MRKQIVLLTVAVILILTIASPALAAGKGQGPGQAPGSGQEQGAGHRYQRTEQNQPELPGRQYFALVGVISGLSSDAITVEIHNGNRFVKPYVGEALTVQLDSSTVYQRWTPEGCVPIGFGEITIGDTTSIHGSVSEGDFLAERVTVDVPLAGYTP